MELEQRLDIQKFNMGIIRGKVNHDEWTMYQDGKPVCGVGYRGYWTNKVQIGDGENPFKECMCQKTVCSGWITKDGKEHATVMNLAEFLKLL